MALATSSAKCRPGADGLVRAARARPTASITSIQASCGFACSRIVPKKPRLSFALGRIVEDPFWTEHAVRLTDVNTICAELRKRNKLVFLDREPRGRRRITIAGGDLEPPVSGRPASHAAARRTGRYSKPAATRQLH